MKKYLLDTHTFIWAIVDKNKLSEIVLDLLCNNETHLFVSAISFWEMAIKHGKGKLYLENFQFSDIPNYCKRLGIVQIPLTPEEAINYSNFPYSENHKDPFDRVLTVQCIIGNYTLLGASGRHARWTMK